MENKYNITIILLLLASGMLFAQNDVLRVQNYGIKDGLSQRDIFKIQQDETGFLWISTRNGMDRFDGHSFFNWYTGDQKNYLPVGIDYDLEIGIDQNMWLSRGDVLMKFDPSENKTDTILDYSSDHSQWLGDLCIDGLGRAWSTRYSVADSSIWLQWVDTDGRSNDIVKLRGNYLKRPITRANGFLYFGAYENEIWVYDLDGKQIRQFEFPAPPSGISYSRVIQLQTDQKGGVWALLDHGQLYHLPPDGNSFIRHPISEKSDDHFHTSAVLICTNGDVWMGGLVSAAHHAEHDEEDSPCSSVQPGVSLLHFNATTNRTEDQSYFLKQVLPYAEAPRQIFQDQSGVIWLATPFGLVHIVENDLFERYMSEGNDCCKDGVCSMRGMTEDEQGNIYFSYYNSLHVLNPRNGSLFPLFSKQLENPFCILYDQGYIWTGNGIRIHVNSSEIDTVVQGLICAEGIVIKDKDGEFWFGCQNKLTKFNPNTQKQTDFKDPSGVLEQVGFNYITYLLQGQIGDFIWMATRENGIFKIAKGKGVVGHYHVESDPALPHNRILALQENSGFLWIASAAGLVRLDIGTDSLTVFNTKNGLANNFINGLLTEGDSALWVSTDNGLSRMNSLNGVFSNFFHSDGLTKNEFNRMSFHKAKDGRMYFGGIDGINAFYPNARYGDRQNKMNSQLLFTEFSKFDGYNDIGTVTGLENNQPVTISAHDHAFTFTYSLADFDDPKTHLYSHILEGYELKWSIPSPLNFVRFFNIPAGKYTLRVKASRGGSEWVNNELRIPITIEQAFYKTTWFRILAIGLAILLFYGFMQYRFYVVKKHEQELELLVQERTQELASEKAKSDKLLLNILPAETAEELKQFGSVKARRFNDATVMFTDFKGFSFIARKMEPEVLVAEIDYCYRAFDEIIDEFELEKIKTIGDAYLCSGGLNEENKTVAAIRVVNASLKIQAFLFDLAEERKGQNRPCFEARIGIHSGPVVGGIVGLKKFAYDIWGDTVNISERLQANGEVGKVNISKSTFEMIKDHFNCIHRGKIQAKHQGEVDMYFIDA